MCDDLLVISECGFKTDLAAAYINSQAQFNSLQFGLSKCSKMHVGKTKQRYKCNPIYLDQWKTEEIENTKTGKVELQESFAGKVKINEVSEVKYLGNMLSSEGTNITDIQAKCNRGVGTVNRIKTILETMFFLGNSYLR